MITLGRFVHYKLSSTDAQMINQRRADFGTNEQKAQVERPGWQAHVGNKAYAGQTYPALVVAIFGNGEHVNLQVFLDGNDTYWATSRAEGDQPGFWAWPPRS